MVYGVKSCSNEGFRIQIYYKLEELSFVEKEAKQGKEKCRIVDKKIY